MDLVAIVKERAEGKDLSVLGGSVKFVVDENVVVLMGTVVKFHQMIQKLHVLFQLMLILCNQLWTDHQVRKLLL